MKAIKKFFFKILPEKAYLRLLHRSFFLLYNLGFLKGKQSFKYHYFIRKLVKENDTVVDIGANLGYFCRTFSKLAKHGKVVAVEPIPQFYEILVYFLGKKSNVEIHNVALGNEAGVLDMVMPKTDGMIRTGLPHIAKNEQEKKQHETVPVNIVLGSKLFSTLEKIDYLKCDIEGYEWKVFQEIKSIFATKRPIVQVEIAPRNETNMLAFFKELGYQQFGIANLQLIQENGEQQEQGDFLFIPKERVEEVLKSR